MHYNLAIKDFKENVLQEKAFQALSLDEQKRMFLTMLDLNQMYVNKSEMYDAKFAIPLQDQAMTEAFYQSKDAVLTHLAQSTNPLLKDHV